MGTPTFEEQVNTALDNMIEVEGKLTFAEDTAEEVKFAANAVRRQRDTQASYTKTQQEIKALQVENESLASQWAADVAKTLTLAQQNELEELKHTDPEAWREKTNAYEMQNANSVKEKHGKIKTKAKEESELQRRERLLTEFNEANPTLALSDEVIDNDIPPRITKKLAEGKIDFEQFIKECQTFLGSPKTIKQGEKAPNDTDLTSLPGDATPQQRAIHNDIQKSYKTETY